MAVNAACIRGGGRLGHERLGLEAVERVLRQSPISSRFYRLQDTLQAALTGGRAHDDVSLACIRVPIEQRRNARLRARTAPERDQVAHADAVASDWRCELAWGPAELRSIDVVQTVLSILSQLAALKSHQGALFLILSELYNNALDHGLLALDSAIKEQEGGFERYLEQRASRLQALSEGRIELGFHLHNEGGHPMLDIRVRDSGPGFDYEDYMTAPHDGEVRPHGRGIALVRSLCRELVYRGGGNEALARYAL